MIDRHDALDELIDETAQKLVEAPPNNWLLGRITANVQDRRRPTRLSTFALASALATLAILIGGVIVQRSFDPRSTTVQRTFTAQASNVREPAVEPPVNDRGTPVARSSNARGASVERPASVRRTPVERPSNVGGTIVEEDFSPFPPVAVSSLSFASLETSALDEAPGDVAPLVVDELPAVSGLSERQ